MAIMYLIEIAQLQIEVHGYQFPNADDYYDANWLNVSIRYAGANSKIWLEEPCLLTVELSAFRDQLRQLSDLSVEGAVLRPLEPYIELEVARAGSLGGLSAKVRLKPDLIDEVHELQMGLDLSYLPGIVAQFDRVLSQFPVRLDSQCSARS